jgi:AraC-like DNA-binding protein
MFLSKSAEFYRPLNIQPLTIMLLERLSDAALLVDAQGNLTYGNTPASDLLECSTENLLAMTIRDLPFSRLPEVWSDRSVSKSAPLCFADKYYTASDEELVVEVMASCEQGINQEYSCFLIHPVSPIAAVEESILPCIPQLETVFRFIKDNYAQSISLRDVATATGYCPSYLTDLVRRCSGQTVNHWIIKCRIALACKLLQKTNDSVNQIAIATGYQNEGHFFRQFRQHCGMTPLAWRKSQQQVG